MTSFARAIDRLNAAIAGVVRWLAALMVVVTVLIVILRYLFEVGAIPLQEAVLYMHGLLFLLAIAYGVQQDTHVRVDLLYSRMAVRQRQLINLTGHIVFLIPVGIFLLVTTIPYVGASWRVLEGSSEVGGIPAVFLLKTLLPIMASLLVLQGLSEVIKIGLALSDRAHR